ncbi:MAG: hypothetical protein SGPRY_006785 [Prymnesium sp.]
MLWLLLGLLLPLGACLANRALVFLKPHAATDACHAFLRAHLSSAGIALLSAGTTHAQEIEQRGLIDAHYGSLASAAMSTEPADLRISPAAREAFVKAYGVEWEDTLGSIIRNDKALAALGVDGSALEGMWRRGLQVKLAPGTYISRLDLSQHDQHGPLYTINGFYPAMREAFIKPGAQVRFMVCEFSESELSWQDFRQKVIGATDPAKAAAGSARAALLERWSELGLESAPTQGLNGVHASAGPLEGLKERIIWAGTQLGDDELASALLDHGLKKRTLEHWLSENPVVTLGGKTDKVFDLTEEISTDALLEMVRLDNSAAVSESSTTECAPPPSGFEWGPTY